MGREQDLLMTVMPLEYFRREVVADVSPYHFWQMKKAGHPIRGYSHIYPHERWMYTEPVTEPITMPAASAKRGPGRLDMLQAIAKAEAALANIDELNTWPGPKYTGSEWVTLRKPSTWKLTYPPRQVPYGLLTRWWNIQAVGTETWTEQPSSPVDISGAYGAEDVTFTATVQSGVTADEVVITYPDTVVPIRPIEVTVSGTTATITIKEWLLGNPDDWTTATPINADDSDNLLQEVDVYRVWMDPSAQLTVYWEPSLVRCACAGGETCAVCQLAGYTACAYEKDYKIGFVGWQFADWDEDDQEYDRTTVNCKRFPERARINYLHGFDTNGDRYMSERWRRTVSVLAAAGMPDYIYDTTDQSQQLAYWCQDLAAQKGKDKRAMSASDIGNQFGTRRGQVEAWKDVIRALGGW